MLNITGTLTVEVKGTPLHLSIDNGMLNLAPLASTFAKLGLIATSLLEKVVCVLLTQGKKCYSLLRDIILSAAEAVDSQQGWSNDPLHWLAICSLEFSGRGDVRLEQVMARTLSMQRKGTSAYKFSKLARTCGRQLPQHSVWADRRDGAQYLKALKRELVDPHHLAVTLDCGRISGRERMLTAILSSASLAGGWLPTQVLANTPPLQCT